eukprot:6190369-Pleurochrysis_carterae.AAC.9
MSTACDGGTCDTSASASSIGALRSALCSNVPSKIGSPASPLACCNAMPRRYSSCLQCCGCAASALRFSSALFLTAASDDKAPATCASPKSAAAPPSKRGGVDAIVLRVVRGDDGALVCLDAACA